MRKKSEEQENLSKSLKESEARYQIILDQSDDIIFEWEFSTDTIQFSQKYKIWFGNAPLTDHVLANSVLRERIHPDDFAVFEEWVANTFCKDGNHEAIYRIKSHDGDYIRLRCRTASFGCDNGLPTKALGIFTKVGKLC